MISCPICRHAEYVGTLVCSECGERLWLSVAPVPGGGTEGDREGAATRITITHGPESTSSGTGPAGDPGQVTLRIRGEPAPVVLSGRDEYHLGRADDGSGQPSDLDLSAYRGLELGVSRRHLVLKRAGEGFVVTDQHSSNGSAINGKRLTPGRTYYLTSGDELRLGKLVMRVYFEV